MFTDTEFEFGALNGCAAGHNKDFERVKDQLRYHHVLEPRGHAQANEPIAVRRLAPRLDKGMVIRGRRFKAHLVVIRANRVEMVYRKQSGLQLMTGKLDITHWFDLGLEIVAVPPPGYIHLYLGNLLSKRGGCSYQKLGEYVRAHIEPENSVKIGGVEFWKEERLHALRNEFVASIPNH